MNKNRIITGVVAGLMILAYNLYTYPNAPVNVGSGQKTYSGNMFDATEKFPLSDNFTNNSKITIIAVNGDISQTCNNERVKRGYKTFSQRSAACSFWSDNVCTVFLPASTDRLTLGHEIQHCFQGNWH